MQHVLNNEIHFNLCRSEKLPNNPIEITGVLLGDFMAPRRQVDVWPN